jgi:adenylyltransferase/sulfurtransferase
MDDQNLLRYNRQIMLPQIDIEGQQKLNQAHVLILGLGGLGSPAAMYLATAGVGHLSLVDFDTVDLSNLQRQIIHDTAYLGELKVDSAKQRLKALNPEVKISTYSEKLNAETFEPLLKDVDVVLDCSDNFETRYSLNDLALKNKLPLVSGAAIGVEGQVSVFDFRNEDSPCYRCLYSEGNEVNLSCSENGVLGPVVGIIASMQALEAIKVITDFGKSLCGKLLVFDGNYSEWRSLNIKKDNNCTCAKNK